MAETGPHETAARSVALRGHRLAIVDDKPTFWAKAEAGDWEPETLAALERIAGPGVLVLDIGAWVGPTTLFSAALGADVLAVEADPAAFALLAANVAANPQLSARISLLRAAAGPKPGTMALGAPRKLGDSMSSVLMAGTGAAAFETEVVTPAALASRLPAAAPLAVKIDIEGGEYALLPAFSPVAERCTQGLLVAFHPRLLAAAGRPAEAIRAATEQCFAALSAFRPEIVESGESGSDVLETAIRRNVTLLFRRK
jgi:FkbM family methyltransferase